MKQVTSFFSCLYTFSQWQTKWNEQMGNCFCNISTYLLTFIPPKRINRGIKFYDCHLCSSVCLSVCLCICLHVYLHTLNPRNFCYKECSVFILSIARSVGQALSYDFNIDHHVTWTSTLWPWCFNCQALIALCSKYWCPWIKWNDSVVFAGVDVSSIAVFCHLKPI